MSKIIFYSTLIVLISSFNMLAYADGDFTFLSLERYNMQLDAMYNALDELTKRSDAYKEELRRVQDILKKTTDFEIQTNLKQVIHEYQTYIHTLKGLTLNLHNNINALGKIVRDTTSTTKRILIPNTLMNVPRIPQPPHSLPATLVDETEKLRRIAEADQRDAQLKRGNERLGRLEYTAQKETRRQEARERAARKTQKITDDFFKELREETYQAQLKKWRSAYPLQRIQKSASRTGKFLKTLVDTPIGFIWRKALPPLAFIAEVNEASTVCENTYNEYRIMVAAARKAKAELHADRKRLYAIKNPHPADEEIRKENLLQSIGAEQVPEALFLLYPSSPLLSTRYDLYNHQKEREDEMNERIQISSDRIALLHQTLNERAIFLTDICRYRKALLNKDAVPL